MQYALYILSQASPLCLGLLLFYSDKALLYHQQALSQTLTFNVLFGALFAISQLAENYFSTKSQKAGKRVKINKVAPANKANIKSLFILSFGVLLLFVFITTIVSLSIHADRSIFTATLFAVAAYSVARSFETRKLYGQSCLLFLLAYCAMGATSIAIVTGSLDWRAVLAGLGLSCLATAARLSCWFWGWELERKTPRGSLPDNKITNRLLRLFMVFWTAAPTCFACLVYLQQLPQAMLVLFGIIPLSASLMNQAQQAQKTFSFTKDIWIRSANLTLFFAVTIGVVRYWA